METGVKWNLDESTTVMIMCHNITKVYARTAPGRDWLRQEDEHGGMSKRNPLTTENMNELINRCESLGYGIMVFLHKEPEQEVLKLSTGKMVEVSAKEFDWNDVVMVEIMKNHQPHIKFVETGSFDSDREPIFTRYKYAKGADTWVKNSFEWYVHEVEEIINGWEDKPAAGIEVVFTNKSGERMNYE